MRTTISVDDRLLEMAKAEAAARGLTLGDLIARALQEHLLRPVPTGEVVELPVFTGTVMSGIESMSNEELLALDMGPDENGLFH